MTRSISNREDYIDSRDILARIVDLTEGMEDGDTLDPEEQAELAALQEVVTEAEGYASGWDDGATLIRDSAFVEYAQELAEDIGAIPSGGAWPHTCIAWDQAAEELQQDYTSVDFDGVTYWVHL